MTTRELQTPTTGQIVRVRQRQHLVGLVTKSSDLGATLVDLSCVDDDAQGQFARVLWEHEVDAEILGGEAWDALGSRRFDEPAKFSAYLHTLSWNCVTSTDPKLLQAPFRAGIHIELYQLEPLVKALALPRVNLFIADDVGLGKTIEAGLIARELLLRRKVDTIVVACPPSMIPQWEAELDARFGLTFATMDRDFVATMRRDRGYAVNPWTTHSRFLVSHRLLADESYAGALRAWLGELRPGSLLILDEAHHAAPASGSRYAIDSKFTHAIRDLAKRFEHRLFLSATPHNGHSNSFSALMELLDPQRFLRGEEVQGKKMLEPVMVRRLKEDLRGIATSGFPLRRVEQIDVNGLPADSAELVLPELLQRYAELREARLARRTQRERNQDALLITGLQHRLLSSIEAFAKTLRVHRRTVERLASAGRPGAATEAQIEPFARPPGADESDFDAQPSDPSALDEANTIVATEATFGAALVHPREIVEELALLERMTEIAENARVLPDARVRLLVDWIRSAMCADLPSLGQHSRQGPAARWNDVRLLVFTEWDDTLRYLVEQLRSAIAGTERADERIAVYHGRSSKDERIAVQAAFNASPARHPLRILVATDAAREGLNLQAHCADSFHFDLPWNPSRLEQRNGRIDRKLQPASEVRCRYFFYVQRPEDRVLQTIVRKTNTIRTQLGSLAAVVEKRIDEWMEHGIRRGGLQRQLEVIEAADIDERTKEVVARELEDQRERRDELTARLEELRSLLERSQQRMGLEEDHLRAALSCSLQMQDLPPLRRLDSQSPGAAQRWEIPQLDQRIGADPSWAETLDTLRPPRRREERVWDWRKSSPVRPVVFEDPGALDADSVHLHLEQRVVQRLLGAFTAQGFVHKELSRACLAQTRDAIPRVVLLGRLCLYGPGASRLHEELVPVTARWIEPSQRRSGLDVYRRDAEARTLELLDQALPAPVRSDRSMRPSRRVFFSAASRDVQELLPHLTERGREHAESAKALLARRGDVEARSMREILESQKKRLLAAQRAVPELMPSLFPDADERRQRDAERKAGAAAAGPRARTRVRAQPHSRDVRDRRRTSRADRARLSLAFERLTRWRSTRSRKHIAIGSDTSSRSVCSSRPSRSTMDKRRRRRSTQSCNGASPSTWATCRSPPTRRRAASPTSRAS